MGARERKVAIRPRVKVLARVDFKVFGENLVGKSQWEVDIWEISGQQL